LPSVERSQLIAVLVDGWSSVSNLSGVQHFDWFLRRLLTSLTNRSTGFEVTGPRTPRRLSQQISGLTATTLEILHSVLWSVLIQLPRCILNTLGRSRDPLVGRHDFFDGRCSAIYFLRWNISLITSETISLRWSSGKIPSSQR